MKPARIHTRIVTLALLAVLGCLVWVGEASAATTVHLTAKPTLSTWISGAKLSDQVALGFSIYRKGREIDRQGRVVSECRYTLFTRHLSLELSNCGRGRQPVRIRYMGSGRFTVRFWTERFAT